MKNLLVSALVALLFGCAAGGATAQNAATRSQVAPDTLVSTDDPELRAMAARLLPGLAERSGLGLRAPVRIERRNRAQLEAFLRSKLDQDMPPQRERSLVDAYSLLGLLPSDFDLRETLLSVYREQVAGFYDPDSTTLYVLDDQPRASLESLLLHELVHAVQDQWIDLESVTAVELGNDRRTAAQAAIEGHATLVMLEFMMDEMQPGGGIDLVEIPDFQALFGPALEGIRSEYPALAGAPRIIQESLLLPYLEGAGFVQEVWQARGGRDAPFGALLPASTEQIADPSRFLSDPPDLPTTVEVVPEEGAAVRVAYSDVLGFAETRVLLEELAGPAAGAAAVGWDGDRWILIDTPGSPEVARGLVWVSVWDSPGRRDRFVASLREGLDAFPVPATLSSSDIDGRPVATLRIGVDTEVDVILHAGGP